MTLRPLYVPLPYVTEYSDTINVGEMGLPVGFDSERLLMHVSAVEKIAKAGDIGKLSIIGFRGDTTEVGYGVGGVSSDGTGTASRAVAVTKARMHDVNMGFDNEFPSDYQWKNATVRINSAEIDTRIRNDGDKWELGPFDVRGRAKYLNKALQDGLAEATQESVLTEDHVTTLLGSALKKSLSVIFYKWAFNIDTMSAAILVDSAIASASVPINHLAVKIRHKDQELPPRQWSLFVNIHYDRLLAAQGLTRSTQLIRAKK